MVSEVHQLHVSIHKAGYLSGSCQGEVNDYRYDYYGSGFRRSWVLDSPDRR